MRRYMKCLVLIVSWNWSLSKCRSKIQREADISGMALTTYVQNWELPASDLVSSYFPVAYARYFVLHRIRSLETSREVVILGWLQEGHRLKWLHQILQQQWHKQWRVWQSGDLIESMTIMICWISWHWHSCSEIVWLAHCILRSKWKRLLSSQLSIYAKKACGHGRATLNLSS